MVYHFYIDVVRVLAILAQNCGGGDDVCITIEMGSVKEKGGKKEKIPCAHFIEHIHYSFMEV